MPEYRLYQKWLAAGVIALVCAGLGVGLWAPVKILRVIGLLDNVLYDSFYRFRSIESQIDGPIVIIAADNDGLIAIQKKLGYGWPWPRAYWGQITSYLDSVGARAIVFDLLFDGASTNNSKGTHDDDEHFAGAVNDATTPTIFAIEAHPNGTASAVIPPFQKKLVGATNISDEFTYRTYASIKNGRDSLALQTIKQAGMQPPAWALSGQPFLLRYFGPHVQNNQRVTFKYVDAEKALEVAGGADGTPWGITPDTFKGKIVLIGTIATSTYDLKSSPLQAQYPGVEVHATALQDMLSNQRVVRASILSSVLVLCLGCFVAATGTVIPTRVPLKLVGGVSGVAIVLMTSASLFLGHNIRWMPPAAGTVAAMLAAFVGLSYSYLTELRQRRFILKAFAQSVSKEVADEVAKDPRKLELGGQRREMTVMFTDLANFTAMTESIKDEKLTAVLQYYLEEMSGVVLGVNGTVDKYIGDAIMAFWNAPTDQSDHPVRACRAALAMRRREKIIQPRLREMSGVDVYSRIGINSGTMVVGNLGSSFKFSYTVIGDSVNLGSRLEGANKIYDTRIMISETTAAVVKDQFLLRKLGLLAVKGRVQPIEVFELIAERVPGDPVPEQITRYEAALELYQARQFERARDALTDLNKAFPEDGPTATLLEWATEFCETPPGPDWNGVYIAKEK
jgi:adenylate cyclase